MAPNQRYMSPELTGIKEENKEFARTAETLLREELERAGILKKYPNIQIRYIGEGIIASGVGEKVEMYNRIDSNNQLLNIFNIHGIRGDYYFDKAAFIAGFREIPLTSGRQKLYQLGDIDMKTGNPFPNTLPIPEFGLPYFRAWETIAFVSDTLAIETSIQKNTEGKYHPMDGKRLDILVHSHSIRLRDMKRFLDNRQIPESLFNQYLPAVQSLLIGQISDLRFDTIEDPITQRELDTYFIQKLIDPSLHSMLSKKLKECNVLKDKKNALKKQMLIDSKEHRKTLR